MHKLRVNDIDIYYQLKGNGFPLVFISGTGMDHSNWLPVLPQFIGNYTCLVFDNRGMGQTSAPPGPYTTAMMADDVAGLLDALGMEKCFLVGISLGSAIAQEVMLRHPQRAKGAVLIGTWAKTDKYIADLLELWADLQSAIAPRDYVRMLLLWTASPDFIIKNPDFCTSFLERASSMDRSPDGYRNQVEAVKKHNTLSRLPEVNIPVFVAHGSIDMVVPVTHGKQVAENLPHSVYTEYAGAAHLLTVERGAKLIPQIHDFLRSAQHK